MSVNLDDDPFPAFDDDPYGGELVRRLPVRIPEKHQATGDTRLQWLWMQRLVVVQSIKINSSDIQDVMTATLVLNATMGKNLPAIELVLRRLEGGAVTDEEVVEQGPMPL